MKRAIIFVVVLLLFAFHLDAYTSPKKGAHFQSTASNILTSIIEGDLGRAGGMAKALEKRLEGMSPAERDFILGYVNYKLGKYAEATEYFSSSLLGIETVRDYALYFLAESFLKSGRPDDAIKYFNELIGDYPDSVWRGRAKWGLAQAYSGSSRFGEALQVLGGIDVSGTRDPSPVRLNVFKAGVLAGLGRPGEAARILKNTYFEADSEEVRKDILSTLKGLKSPEAKGAVAEINSYSGRLGLADNLIMRHDYDEAVPILEDLARGDKSLHMKEVLANAYFKSRDYKKSLMLYQELVSEKGESVFYLTRLAQSAARMNDFDTAIGAYNSILKKSGKGSSRVLPLYKLGFLYMDSHRYAAAAGYFLDIVNSGYRGHLLKNVYWRLAWCYYKLGRPDDAIIYFEKLAHGFGDDLRTQARYWIAKVYEMKGDRQQANAIYRDLMGADRFGYYGFRAAGNLGEGSSMPPTWADYGSGVNVDAGKLPSAGRLAKARYLADLGLRPLAHLEVKEFDRRNLRSLDEAAAFMSFARGVGDCRSAYLTAIERFKGELYLFPRSEGVAFEAWKGFYPDAGGAVVEKMAKELGLDPKLVYSIMREESRFQADAVSQAGAVGLMQLIPPTARRIAHELHDNPFEVEDLYDPETNVRFGTKYLGNLAKMFEEKRGNSTLLKKHVDPVVCTIASYNAGEEAVSRWVDSSDAKNVEEFIEEIPYDETNKYVKKVLKSYWIYNELY